MALEQRVERLEQALIALVATQTETQRALRDLAEAQRQSVEQTGQLAQAVVALAEAQARTGERVGRLEEAVTRLAEAQARTEERVGRLEERTARLEAAVIRLAEAQARTEERIERLEAAVQALAERMTQAEERLTRLETAVTRLAEAQARTEERVERLEAAVKQLAGHVERLGQAVGQLQETVGSTAEEAAADVLEWLCQQRGYRPLEPAYNLAVNGEVDLVQPVLDPTGRRLWIVVEVKIRLGWRAVRDWHQRLRSEGFRRRLARAGLPGPFLPYIFGLRVDRRAAQTARELGLGLLTSRGEDLAPASEVAGFPA